MRRTILLLVTGVTFATGCSEKLVIESDTQWSGAIGATTSATVDGSGNRTMSIDGGTCWTLQKQTETGRLRAYAKSSTITGSNTSGDATTVAAYGVVSGCAP